MSMLIVIYFVNKQSQAPKKEKGCCSRLMASIKFSYSIMNGSTQVFPQKTHQTEPKTRVDLYLKIKLNLGTERERATPHS